MNRQFEMWLKVFTCACLGFSALALLVMSQRGAHLPLWMVALNFGTFAIVVVQTVLWFRRQPL